MTQIVGRVGDDREIVDAIVIPADVDPIAYAAQLGLAGEWVDLTGSIYGIGATHAGGALMYRWSQIAGADLGEPGAESGFPVGALVYHLGIVWRSRVQFNVNEPLLDVTTTWSREDGRFVTPAGWAYQPGEDLTADDGATWWRVVQATSFAPSAFPAAYARIDRKGGSPVTPPVGQWAPGQTVAVGDLREFQGRTYQCRQAHTTQAGWTPAAVPALWLLLP
jgi:hypothetical protein